LSQNQEALKLRHNVEDLLKYNAFVDEPELPDYIEKLYESKRNTLGKQLDPVMAHYSPACVLGATSEKFSERVSKFIAAHPEVDGDTFKALMNIKYHSWYDCSIAMLLDHVHKPTQRCGLLLLV
jgi:hypothetical protein